MRFFFDLQRHGCAWGSSKALYEAIQARPSGHADLRTNPPTKDSFSQSPEGGVRHTDIQCEYFIRRNETLSSSKRISRCGWFSVTDPALRCTLRRAFPAPYPGSFRSGRNHTPEDPRSFFGYRFPTGWLLSTVSRLGSFPETLQTPP